MIRTRIYRWLLYLFPREFRAQFGDDIDDYLALRRLEAEAAGRWAVARVSVDMARDLAIAALTYRARTLSPSRIARRVVATAMGCLFAAASISTVFVAFERTIHLPLLAAVKGGTGAADPALSLAVLTVGIVTLIAIYASLRPRPEKWRQSANHTD